jgi:enoyl-CoA hydratase
MGDTVLYEKQERTARITLNRPERFNAIDSDMPGELRGAVERADEDSDVHVTVLTGAGEAFCSGYDLKEFAEEPRPTEGSQEMPWDPTQYYRMMKSNTEDFMSLLYVAQENT